MAMKKNGNDGGCLRNEGQSSAVSLRYCGVILLTCHFFEMVPNSSFSENSTRALKVSAAP